MADSENQDLRDALAKLGQHMNNQDRLEAETPITALSPEAHEDAMKIAPKVWVKAMSLMGDKDYYSVTSQQGKHLLAMHKGRQLDNYPHLQNTDLRMSRDIKTAGDGVDHIQHEIYEFTPEFVLRKILRRTEKQKPLSLDLLKKPNYELDEILPPKGRKLEKEEANRDQLEELLVMLEEDRNS